MNGRPKEHTIAQQWAAYLGAIVHGPRRVSRGGEGLWAFLSQLDISRCVVAAISRRRSWPPVPGNTVAKKVRPCRCERRRRRQGRRSHGRLRWCRLLKYSEVGGDCQRRDTRQHEVGHDCSRDDISTQESMEEQTPSVLIDSRRRAVWRDSRDIETLQREGRGRQRISVVQKE